jgi:hypothetical protein
MEVDNNFHLPDTVDSLPFTSWKDRTFAFHSQYEQNCTMLLTAFVQSVEKEYRILEEERKTLADRERKVEDQRKFNERTLHDISQREANLLKEKQSMMKAYHDFQAREANFDKKVKELNGHRAKLRSIEEKLKLKQEIIAQKEKEIKDWQVRFVDLRFY